MSPKDFLHISLGSMMISYLSLAYAMAPLLLLYFISMLLYVQWCSYFSLLTPTATRCYITMITPKHPFS